MARSKTDTSHDLTQTLQQLFPSLGGESDAAGLKLLSHQHIEVQAQPRVQFPADEISELSRSIAELHARGDGIEGTGILQPLLVAPLPYEQQHGEARYRLIAGERRFRASQQAGLTQIPALVVSVREDSILLAQLIENLQRQGLPPLDEARSLQKLMQEQSLSYRDAAKVLGKTRSYLTDRVSLLKMGQDIQEMVSARADTLHHARIIDAIEDANLRQELIQATRDGAPRREIERRIEVANSPSTSVSASTVPSTPQKALDEVTSVKTNQATPALNLSTSSTPNNDHHSSTSKVSARADTLLSQLQPATAMVAEAARVLEEATKIAPGQARQISEQIRDLEQQIARIKKTLDETSSSSTRHMRY